MLNISIFDITYSNYGKYLESNVFLQKQKQKKQREESENIHPQHQQQANHNDLKQRQRSLHSAMPKSHNLPTSSMPTSTIHNSKTANNVNKRNPFFTAQSSLGHKQNQQNNSSLNHTIGGNSLGINNKDKNQLNLSYQGGISNNNNNNILGDRPRTTSQGTAVFRSVERAKTPGFCHFFHRENQSEIKYQPKYDLITGKAPAFSISKAVCERVITDGIQLKPESKKDTVIQLCTKNPLLKDVQELEYRINEEIVKDQQNGGGMNNTSTKFHQHHHHHTHHNDGKNLDALSHYHNHTKNTEEQLQQQNKKRNSRLSISHTFEDNTNKNQQQVQSKTFYAQRALRQRYSILKQNTTTLQTNTNEDIHNNTSPIHALQQYQSNTSQHIKQTGGVVSPQNHFNTEHNNHTFTNQSQNIQQQLQSSQLNGQLLQQQTSSQSQEQNQQQQSQSNNKNLRKSLDKRRSTYENKAISAASTLNNINNAMQKEQSNTQQRKTIISLSKTNPPHGVLTKSDELMQAKESKIGGQCNGEMLAFAEMMNTKNSQNEQFIKKGFHVKIGKQTNRPSSVQRPVSSDEIRFNNFTLLNTNPDKSHPFTSYTVRKVFVPKDNAPSYDIHKVNYDRLLTNDHHNQGNVSFDSKPVSKIAVSKHEVMNQNMYSNLKHNEVLSASVRLDYPLIEQAYFQQSGVKRPHTMSFEKSSPRKKNLFPKQDGKFNKDNLNETKQGFQDYTVTYYQPGDISNRHSNNNTLHHF